VSAPALSRVTTALTEAGLLRRPGLRTDESDRSASWLELFFDLAFVLVVAELAGALGEDLSAHGALTFAGLFAVTWWAWASSTLYANRFDTDDLPFRALKLLGMLAIIGIAASAAEATSKYTE
jgi:low temperature requirement protein LtrA